ncbi:MAG: hypothetical protein K0R48_292 [Gammaproteobacteria bacterium]|jgi:type II secretory pathway pseudopilin PulG|nr:hypothetical protein [Gammaproteobacteria bacterium]
MKQMLMRKPISKMAGITLLETMFAIAVGALIVIAAVIFYTSTKNSQNTSKATTDINTIVAAADNYIAPGSAALNALITPEAPATDAIGVLQGVGYLPTPMSDPWGGNYTATVAASTGTNKGSPGTIAITISSLGYDDALCLAVANASQGAATGDVEQTVDGKTTGGLCEITRNL